MFLKPAYRGNHFFETWKSKKVSVTPTVKGGGSWLRHMKKKGQKTTSRFCRAILGHAPIGQYRHRFFPREHLSPACKCGAPVESQYHVLRCPRWEEFSPWRGATPRKVLIEDFSEFIVEAVWAFEFPPEPG